MSLKREPCQLTSYPRLYRAWQGSPGAPGTGSPPALSLIPTHPQRRSVVTGVSPPPGIAMGRILTPCLSFPISNIQLMTLQTSVTRGKGDLPL